MATKKTQIEIFYDRQRELHSDVIKALKQSLKIKKEFNLEDSEQEFEDESFNTIVKIDRDTVYTDGVIGEYPIGDLTINDALYILRAIRK
jgi:hypothetical protein